jgi:hypothetical protein
MAPSVSDPRELLVVLNPARRKALYTLIRDITGYMRSQISLPADNEDVAASDSWDAPLFVPPRSFSGPEEEEEEEAAVDPASVSQRHVPPSAELRRVRQAALAHFDTWSTAALSQVREALSPPDDNQILESRRQRVEKVAAMPKTGEDLIDFGAANTANKTKYEDAQAVQDLQKLYHPITTRLTTIPAQDRIEALSAVLLLLLAKGHYSAESRVLAIYLTSALELPLDALLHEETEIASQLVQAATSDAAKNQANNGAAMSADAEAAKRRQEGQSSRYWKVGLASVAGAALIGVTGGLAAPVVAGAIGGLMGTVGLGGVASFLGIFWMNGALVGTLFGAFGARMTVSSSTPGINNEQLY